jgi:hypothetical protein
MNRQLKKKNIHSALRMQIYKRYFNTEFSLAREIKNFAAEYSKETPISAMFQPTLRQKFQSTMQKLMSFFEKKASLLAIADSAQTTTDHKQIGKLYIVFGFFSAIVGSIFSLIIRIQLTYPGSVFLGQNYQLYNIIITMHAFIIIFMFVMPVLIGGFGNFIVPLHLGIPDVAFPRLNALSF